MNGPSRVLSSPFRVTLIVAALTAAPSLPAGGTTPLTVSITRPANGATLTRRTVTVWVKAAGAGGIEKVDLYVDGKWAASRTETPWRFAWDSKQAGIGPHLIVAQARDHAGHRADSPAVLVYRD